MSARTHLPPETLSALSRPDLAALDDSFHGQANLCLSVPVKGEIIGK